MNCIRKAVELAFGVTVEVEQVGLLWSTERIGSLSRKRDMKSVQLLSFLTCSSIVTMLLSLNVLGAEVRKNSKASTC